MNSEKNEVSKQFRIRNQWFLIVAVMQMLFNTLLYPWLIPEALTFGQTLKNIAQMNFITLTILGFLIGLLIALFPYKGLRYPYRYLRSSLIFILVVQSVEMMGLLLIAVMKWGLHYPI